MRIHFHLGLRALCWLLPFLAGVALADPDLGKPKTGIALEAEKLLYAGQYKEAEPKFRRLVEQARFQVPMTRQRAIDYAFAHDGFSVCLFRRGQLALAAEHAKKALDAGKNTRGYPQILLSALYNNLGFVLKEQGKSAEALTYYNEAVRLSPVSRLTGRRQAWDNTVQWENIGDLYRELAGRHTLALEAYRKAYASHSFFGAHGGFTMQERWEGVYIRARLAELENDPQQQIVLLEESLGLIPEKAFLDPRRLDTLRMQIESFMMSGEKARAVTVAQDLWQILTQARVAPEHRYRLLYFMAQFWLAVGQLEELQQAIPVIRQMYAGLTEEERQTAGWNPLFSVQGSPVRDDYLRILRIAGAHAAYASDILSGIALPPAAVCDSSSGRLENLALDDASLVRLGRADLSMARLSCVRDYAQERHNLAVPENAPDDAISTTHDLASLALAQGQSSVAEREYQALLARLIAKRLPEERMGLLEIESRYVLSTLLHDRGQTEAAEHLTNSVREALAARAAGWEIPDLNKPNLRSVSAASSYALRAGGGFIISSRINSMTVHEHNRAASLYDVFGLDNVAASEISRDGRLIAFSSEGFIRVFDTASLQLVSVIPFNFDWLNTGFQFSPDGKFITTANGKTVRTWRVADATLAWQAFPKTTWGTEPLLRYSRDGRFLYLGLGRAEPGSIEKLDALTGKLLAQSQPLNTQALFVSGDGESLIVFAQTDLGRHWVLRLNAHSLAVEGLITLNSSDDSASADLISPSGRFLAIPEREGIGLWDTTTWQRHARYPSQSKRYAWRQDDVLIGLARGGLEFFAIGEGKLAVDPGQKALRIAGLGFSGDGERLALRVGNRFMRLELKTGSVIDGKDPMDGLGDLARLWPETNLFNNYWRSGDDLGDGLSPLAVDVSGDGSLRAHHQRWLSIERTQGNSAAGKQDEVAWAMPLDFLDGGFSQAFFRFSGNSREIGLVQRLDMPGSTLGEVSNTFKFQRRDAQTGRLLGSMIEWRHSHGQQISMIALLPDAGNDFLLLLDDGSLTRIHGNTGRRELLWQNDAALLGFGSEATRSLITGQILVVGSKGLAILDGASGGVLWRQALPFVNLRTATLSPDGRYIAALNDDGTVFFFDGKTGEHLLRMYFFENGDWAAVDVENRFDTWRNGEVAGLHWVVGSTSIEFSQLKERYFEPGLIPRALQLSAEKRRPVAEFVDPKLFPKIESRLISLDGTSALEILLTNQGGGIGTVRVSLNGKEVVADARPPNFDAGAGSAKLKITLPGHLMQADGKNEVEVVAWNAEGYLASRGVRVRYARDVPANNEPPSLFAIVAGVSKYANPAMNLSFPAKDARDIAHALRLGAARLFGTQRSDITLFSDFPGDADSTVQPVSRQALKAAFDNVARKAKPGDILVVYLAGHGVMSSGEKSDYFFLTPEARSTDLSDPAIRDLYGISSAVMTEWIKAIPAMKQVMVLDTCAAGGAVERLTQVRALSADQVRALDRLKDRTGFHVLMGAAADKVSYESSQYGQGLLTYAILQGMKGAALREGEYVDVSTLFQHAADQVPLLAKSIGGIQKPVIASPRGSSFDIGQMTMVEKRDVTLADRRPMFLRAVLQDVRRPIDLHGIGRQVNRVLRERATNPESAKLVFIDAEDLPGAYLLAGRYERKGNRLRISAALFRDETEVSTKQIDLPLEKENTAGAFIVEWALGALPPAGSDVRKP